EGYVTSNFRAPNNWRVDQSTGRFTKDWETDEYRQALAFNLDLYTTGVYSPSTANYNNVSAKADFSARKFAVRVDGWQPSELQYYGIRGVDYTPDDRGNPQLTDKGKLDTAVPWQWLTQGPLFDFNPNAADYATVMQDAAKAFRAVALEDPSLGQYSATQQTK